MAVSQNGPDYGIVISPAIDITPGQLSTVTPDPTFLGRAIIMPPGSVPTAANQTFCAVVGYIGRFLGPTQVFIPGPPPGPPGILYADLPTGLLPPASAVADGLTLEGAINSAINNQGGGGGPPGTDGD
jgi:hypothetical protein